MILSLVKIPAHTPVSRCALGLVVVSTPRWAVCDESGNVVCKLGLFANPDPQVFTRKYDAEQRRRELEARQGTTPLQCVWPKV